MAIEFQQLKKLIVVTLYDYMLTSDEDAHWYSVKALRQTMDPDISGALMKIALTSLDGDSLVETGADFNEDAIYSLTEDGIAAAEVIIKERGVNLDHYGPSPNSDRIITPEDSIEAIQQIIVGLEDISKLIRTNNSISSALGDDRDMIANEMKAASVIVAGDRFSLQRLRALLSPALRFLADKFSGSAIGEVAKRLMDILWNLQ